MVRGHQGEKRPNLLHPVSAPMALNRSELRKASCFSSLAVRHPSLVVRDSVRHCSTEEDDIRDDHGRHREAERTEQTQACAEILGS